MPVDNERRIPPAAIETLLQETDARSIARGYFSSCSAFFCPVQRPLFRSLSLNANILYYI